MKIILSNNIKRYIYLIISLFIMLFIFIMSAQSGGDSNEQSGGFIEHIAQILVEGYEDLAEDKQLEIVSDYQFIVRKSAHIGIYFVLSIFVSLYIYSFKQFSNGYGGCVSVLICVLYAASDEIHQFFVSGRACKLFDIFIDFIGIFFGVLLVSAVLLIIFKKRRVGYEKQFR